MVVRFLLWLTLLAIVNFNPVESDEPARHLYSTGGKSSRLVSTVPQEPRWLARQAAAALRYHWLTRVHPGPDRQDYRESVLRGAAPAIKSRNRPAQVQLPPLLQEACATPQSLMLHSGYGAENMVRLADAIEAAGLETTTYRAVLEKLRRGQCPPENAVIVSIDDLSTRWIRPDFREMIQVFTDRGMVLVLGVVTQSPQMPAIWEYLRELEHQGHEVASHTMNHFDLPQLDGLSLHIELSGSYEVLCENLDRCPVTLILPFGDLGADNRVMSASADYIFVAGIPDGRSFEGEPPYYLGRIPPDTQGQIVTMELLRNSFHP